MVKSHKIIITSFILGLSIFVIDILVPLGVAGGVPYVTLVLISLWSVENLNIIYAAIAGTILTIIGYYLSPETGGISWMIISNRFLAIFAIWVTAVLAFQRKIHEEKLTKYSEELKKHRDQLDELVKDRTKELSERNIQLKKEIANRKKAELELLSSKEKAEAANRAKSNFLAAISHELRTPLNAVIGFSGMLKDRYFVFRLPLKRG